MEIRPYERNPKKHPNDQLKHLAEIVKEVGWRYNCLVNEEGVIISGHGRYMCWQKYKDKMELPDIWITDTLGRTVMGEQAKFPLTKEQETMLRIADNKVAESGWDMDLIEIELDTLSLEMQNLTGFDITKLDDNTYTKKIKSPIYEPKNEKPSLKDIVNTKKADDLQELIKNSKLPEKEKDFLLKAATRFYEFNYAKIADYYAHSDGDTKDLMEKLALVIIDYDKAIENGFVQLTDYLMNIEGYDEE